jgi:hypothetical protein
MKIVIKSEDIPRRNPVAAELASGRFAKRVIRDRKKYSRKRKHKKTLDF